VRKTKVIILHNFMAPYRLPLFAEIAKNKTLDVEVFFLSESAKNRRWRISSGIKLPFKFRVLPKLEFNFQGKDLFAWIFNPTFPFELIKSKYDVIISAGWLDFACQAAFFLSKILKKPYIIWSESTIYEPSWRRTVTRPLVKLIVRHSDACIPIGTRAKEYLIKLGASPEKTFVAISTVDIKHFEKTSKLTEKEKAILKKKLGIKTKKLILFVGQLIERKGLKFLLPAFARLKKDNPDVGLLIVGYGPQKQELLNICQKEKVGDVYFSGHVEVDQMPKMYGLANLFVLPSTEETWGLVINEAMASGLPIITANKVGASVDLVKNGENGYVVKGGNVNELYKAMKKIVENPMLLSKMGKRSQSLIKNFGPDSAAKGFLKAIDYVTKKN